MRKMTVIKTLLIIILTIVALYATVVYSNIGFIKHWRGIWIETAMTTGEHQWLATKFFPKDMIDEVMAGIVTTTDADDEVMDLVLNSKFEDKYYSANVGDTDDAGNKIYAINEENKLAIVEIKGETYRGKAVLVFEPELVEIAMTNNKGVRGENIKTIMKNNDAIVAVNASGFGDPNGRGSGGTIMGASRNSEGDWGTYTNTMDTIAFDIQDRLLVGRRGNWNEWAIRDACQFNPSLIINGKQNVEGTAGWGLQPRTAIGQREDGTVIIIVVDGRQPTHSVGATMNDLVAEFQKYDVINAAACDGGSSSIMGYDGNIITKCCSPQVGGRYLPNAFIVKRVDNDSIKSNNKVLDNSIKKVY